MTELPVWGTHAARLVGVPLAIGLVFGCLQLGAAAELPLQMSIAAWIGFAFIYWAAFEICGHALGGFLRPLGVPLIVVLILGALMGKIVGRPLILKYGQLFWPYLDTSLMPQPKPYSQFTFSDLARHLWNNLPLILAWIATSLYFHLIFGLKLFGYSRSVYRPEAPAEQVSRETAPLPAKGEPAPPLASANPGSAGIAALAHVLPVDIVAMSAEDHYVRLHFVNGRSVLILYRFATALCELDSEDGVQVHRSHWVRRSAVTGGSDLGRSGRLHLVGGAEVPVSHAYVQLVRRAGFFGRTPVAEGREVQQPAY